MSKQAEQQSNSLEALEKWVSDARTLTGNRNPAVKFKYSGQYAHEEIPTTFNYITDVTYSLVTNKLTFHLSE